MPVVQVKRVSSSTALPRQAACRLRRPSVVEVLEHLDPPRLRAFERMLFEFARPGTVKLTTPKLEFNVTWETLPAGTFRHPDHCIEWNRDEFQEWATGVASRLGYAMRFLPVVPEHPEHGSPTQTAVFTIAQSTGSPIRETPDESLVPA